jgi:hypothetical protein
MRYVMPTVTDLGTLEYLTQSITVVGPEDGASKDQPQHHLPGLAPISLPTGP